MVTWVIIWLAFWISVMGFPLYLFKKRNITQFGNCWPYTAFYIFSIFVLCLIYKNVLFNYFVSFSIYNFLIVLFLLVIWLLTPLVYQKDYYTKKERFGYQLPKFFDILFQQLCILGGLLTLGFSPIAFAALFFAVHAPGLFFLSKKFAMVVTTGSFLGGFIFASLQLLGIKGFITALTIHLVFWLIFHYLLSFEKGFMGIVPMRR